MTCFLFGCGHKNVSGLQDFKNWLADESNGYTITKSINGLNVAVSLLPPEYMAAMDMDKKQMTNASAYDSLVSAYKYQVNLLMCINSKDDQNVLYKGIKDQTEYSQRLNELNFAIENLASLNGNGKNYRPVLTAFENNYGLTNDIKINILFTPTTSKDELLTASTLDFEYADESFGLGTIHCFFDKKNISNNLPVLNRFKN
ncbi:MAG: hypothetical protein K0S32_3991 [Bacteroidetes bacterium]|jgi:hypothetical protein|nr:hypothetical protein [Bacteroidota bacterium]